MRRHLLQFAAAAALCTITSAQGEPDGPWRLGEALGLPEWLSIGGEHRIRYETFDEQFRTFGSGNSKLYSLRTLLWLEARLGNFSLFVEGIDARGYDPSNATPLNTGLIDAVDLLQAYTGYRDGSWEARAGRITMDVGSRRLVARNKFRNTINSFTGVDAQWTDEEGSSVRGFAVLPVRRLPRDFDSLEDNDIRYDEESSSVRFFGVHGFKPRIFGSTRGEAYALALDESDSSDVATSDRRLWSLGARVFRKPTPGAYHFDWESIFQTGESRATASATDTADLDHEAHFHHLSVGYQFESAGQPILDGIFDYASGDSSPNDGENNRFDTLFGQNRDYQPVGIFALIRRSNVIAPGIRLRFTPQPNTQVMLQHRYSLLASDTDALPNAGLVDPTGATDREIGHVTEFRVRHELIPKSLRIEVGAAHLFAGDFITDAPNSTTPGDTTYFYISSSIFF